MSTPSPLLSAEQRAWRYWFDDGLPNLVAGIGCLSFGAFLAYDRSENATLLTIAVCFAGLILYSAVILFPRQIVEWLKSRITYPRTGYANPISPGESGLEVAQRMGILAQTPPRHVDIQQSEKLRRKRALLTSAFVCAAGIGMVFIHSRWASALAGVLIALALGFWGRKVYRVTWLVAGGFALIGLLLSALRDDQDGGTDRMAYFLLAAGGLLILNGTLALLRHLRANPRPSQIEP